MSKSDPQSLCKPRIYCKNISIPKYRYISFWNPLCGHFRHLGHYIVMCYVFTLMFCCNVCYVLPPPTAMLHNNKVLINWLLQTVLLSPRFTEIWHKVSVDHWEVMQVLTDREGHECLQFLQLSPVIRNLSGLNSCGNFHCPSVPCGNSQECSYSFLR